VLLNSAGDGIFGIDIQERSPSLTARRPGSRLGGGGIDWQPVSTILQQIRINRSAPPQDDLFTGRPSSTHRADRRDDEFKSRDGKTSRSSTQQPQVREGTTCWVRWSCFANVTDRRESESLRTRQSRQAPCGQMWLSA